MRIWLLEDSVLVRGGQVFAKTLGIFGLCAASVASGALGGAAVVFALGGAWIGRDLAELRGASLVFRVADSRLHIQRSGMADLDLNLEQVHELHLEARTSLSARSNPWSGGVHAGEPGRESPASSRIMLVTQAETLALHDDFLDNRRCNEKILEIRRFLRAQGWAPLAERAPENPASERG